jgi:membrane-associated protease RseP (regulator of RpoE activity)
MLLFIYSLSIALGLLLLHECGHLLCAYWLKIPVRKVGFKLNPFPHAYVAIRWPSNKLHTHLFLFSGFAVFLLMTSLFYVTGLFQFSFIKNGFIMQCIFETNPFYSDFIIVNLISKSTSLIKSAKTNYKEVYKQVYLTYLFSTNWYIHFILWTILTYLITK